VSKSIANALYRLNWFLASFLSHRQRDRVLSRIDENIQRDSIRTIETNRGALRFKHLASAYVASGVERFHDDEPETLQWLDGFQDGELFWDIGANVGLYSLYAALGTKIKAYAFEPNALNYGLLVEHIKLNRLEENITALCLAFSDTTDVESLFVPHDVPGSGSSLSSPSSQFGEYKPLLQQGIISYEMDKFREYFDLAQPDHVKIDVDGMEPQIIRGGIKTLSGAKSLLIEVEGNNTAVFDSEINKMLAAIGFAENRQTRDTGSQRNRLYVNQNLS
jgi:FkbM family methyltransferase